MNDLKKFVYFHDWNIDILAVREGNRLILGLNFDDKRATVTFAGTSRCVVEHFGMVNIVYDIKLLQPDDARYAKVLAVLEKSDRYSHTPGHQIAVVSATAGAELVVEFDSLEIELA
ncbi:conserved hypothetical protein [Paraburkholderia sacchari]|uniref:hypothetical protein n=1 Tax=Paraburkholderia sacchari TaxID=159450 RepID=UPI0039A5A669